MANWNEKTRKWEFNREALEAELEATLEADRLKDADAIEEPVAISVRYLPSESRFRLDLSNGTTYLFPADACQGLRDVPAEALADVHIRPGGESLHWPALNEDYSVMALVLGIFGSERWMKRLRQENGKMGGRMKSPAKTLAARLNGRKGGKPRSIFSYTMVGEGYEVRLGEHRLGRIERIGGAKHPRWQVPQLGNAVFQSREGAAMALHAQMKASR